MKFVSPSHFTDPDAAARKLVQIANASEVVQEGRIYIELVNNPFLNDGGTPDQCRAALARAVTVGLAVAARVRNLCEIHACRRRAFRLMAAKGWQLRRSDSPAPWSPARDAVGCRALRHQVAQSRTRSARMASRDGSPDPGGDARRPNDVCAHWHDAGTQPPRRARVRSVTEGKARVNSCAIDEAGSRRGRSMSRWRHRSNWRASRSLGCTPGIIRPNCLPIFLDAPRST
jgi:hypothetical protein